MKKDIAMGIEEKVKAYDEALKQAKKELAACGSMNCDATRLIFRLFPKLRESEDERARKAALEGIEYLERKLGWDAIGNTDILDVKEYLEKQKEQKPVQSEDEREYVRIIKSIVSDFIQDKKPEDVAYYQKIYDWLDRRHVERKEQKPAEWSEDDEEMYINVASSLRGYAYGLENEEHKKHIKKGLDWLENRFKSLRPQPKKESAEEKIMNFFDAIGDCGFTQADILKLKSIWKECGLPSPQPHWKPSNEQINYLGAAVIEAQIRHNESTDGFPRYRVLKELYEQLLKL